MFKVSHHHGFLGVVITPSMILTTITTRYLCWSSISILVVHHHQKWPYPKIWTPLRFQNLEKSEKWKFLKIAQNMHSWITITQIWPYSKFEALLLSRIVKIQKNSTGWKWHKMSRNEDFITQKWLYPKSCGTLGVQNFEESFEKWKLLEITQNMEYCWKYCKTWRVEVLITFKMIF